MIAGHDRFESLAGAIALGEATAAERETFERHAAGCARCADDADIASGFTALLGEARASEQWRPSVDNAVVRRIRESRRSRTRRTIGALGWCVAVSFVVEAAFVTGLGGRLNHAFDGVAGPATVAAAAPPALAPGSLEARRSAAPLAVRKHGKAPQRYAPLPAVRALRAARAEAPPAEPAVPDVLAGLDLYGKKHPTSRNVALEVKQNDAAAPVEAMDASGSTLHR